MFISIANLVAFFLHLGGLITAAIVNNPELDFSKPSISIYMHSINFTITRGDEVGSGVGSGVGSEFELRPELQKTGSLSLRALTMSFFAVSAFFHLVIFLDAAWFQKFYFRWLNECIAPIRWIE